MSDVKKYIDVEDLRLVNDSQGFSQGDYISRRKAFEYFVTLWNCIGTIMDRDEWEDVCMTTANEIPSAQPEIIQCKDCYWWEKQEASSQGRCDRYGFYPTGYWYCAGARERKDNETD